MTEIKNSYWYDDIGVSHPAFTGSDNALNHTIAALKRECLIVIPIGPLNRLSDQLGAIDDDRFRQAKWILKCIRANSWRCAEGGLLVDMRQMAELIQELDRLVGI